MKIAIHPRKGSFSERWIEYCKKQSIPYKLVNAYETDIINQLDGCCIFLWHHHHGIYKDALVAKKILFSLEHSGVRVFPDFKTGWHFDDKVAQKYLLESIGAPLVPSYVFYNKKLAFDWASKTVYPKVFKLASGAGAVNVQLINSRHDAIKVINKAFGNGFSHSDRYQYFKDKISSYKAGRGHISHVLKAGYRLFFPVNSDSALPNEKGYVYFQEFIPNNSFDIRVIVIKDKAFAIKRKVRTGDFRASGSGEIIYDIAKIDIRCIKIGFETSEKLKADCLAYDFVFDEKDNPLIVEISYGFSIEAYDKCTGYWNRDLQWNDCTINPQEWMVENLIKELL
ncbi:hypothetical protein [Pseudoalteromonas sp. OF7H-1]|uniref:ATP-grasp domain-containing protein n=1 Tax=Pseudoalteromonas sp. OF7H-1 TaxID=2917755 RepID=UPI001EF5854A|nr:hypothetical protein [Pseudoalteromonas sp. OF7H-1]MCG7538910.1 hypothetical protein [Pseudoalteromonas sp. OF7H-1]